MALSISIGADGRISPKGTNVVIPNNLAGIGDMVYKSGGDIKVIGCGTASASSISIGGSTYMLYGCIYGFVNGMAMVLAPEESSKQWAISGVSAPSDAPQYGWGTALMRNGNKHTYVQMNVAQNSNYIKGGSSAPVILGSAYQATSLTPADFATAASADIKARFGTWEQYIRQTLRVNGAPGTPFGAVASGVKVHEFGKWMTSKLTSSNYPAGQYAWNYGGGDGEWWLPSMYELAEMMIDEHYTRINENNTPGFSRLSSGSYRWSSVVCSSGYAWSYDYDGMSDHNGLTYSLMVRPVTLLKL